MHTMTYRGYSAHIAYSDEDQCFVGHIARIQDIVGFHAASMSALPAAFLAAVEDYLDTCAQLGRPPQQPQQIPHI